MSALGVKGITVNVRIVESHDCLRNGLHKTCVSESRLYVVYARGEKRQIEYHEKKRGTFDIAIHIKKDRRVAANKLSVLSESSIIFHPK